MCSAVFRGLTRSQGGRDRGNPFGAFPQSPVRSQGTTLLIDVYNNSSNINRRPISRLRTFPLSSTLIVLETADTVCAALMHYCKPTIR